MDRFHKMENTNLNAPGSRVLRMLLASIEREALAKMQAAVDAEQADRGYPDEAQYDQQAHVWTVPVAQDDGADD